MTKYLNTGVVILGLLSACMCLTVSAYAWVSGWGNSSGSSGSTFSIEQVNSAADWQSSGTSIANTEETKLHIMSAGAGKTALMDDYGHLSANIKSGDTGYYNKFPVIYTQEGGKGYTFTVQFSINGWQSAGGGPLTKTFTCQNSRGITNTLKNVKEFIDTRTDPDRTISPSTAGIWIPTDDEERMMNQGVALEDRIYSDEYKYCGFTYAVYSMGLEAESVLYYQKNGVEKEEKYQTDIWGNAEGSAANHAKDFIMDNALISTPL